MRATPEPGDVTEEKHSWPAAAEAAGARRACSRRCHRPPRTAAPAGTQGGGRKVTRGSLAQGRPCWHRATGRCREPVTTALMTSCGSPRPPARPRPGPAALLDPAAGPSSAEPPPRAPALGRAAPGQRPRALGHLLTRQLLPVPRLLGRLGDAVCGQLQSITPLFRRPTPPHFCLNVSLLFEALLRNTICCSFKLTSLELKIQQGP